MDKELRALVEDIIRNPDKIDSMTPEQVMATMKKTAPYGAVGKAKKSYVNLSIVNYREEYLTKFLTTALIGYQYRALQEYEVSEDFASFLKDPALGLQLSEEQYAKITKAAQSAAKSETRRFLDRNFNFDPDRHVASSYKDNTDDPERVKKHDAYRENMKTASGATSVLEEMKKDPNAALEFSQDSLLKAYQLTTASRQLIQNILNAVNDPSLNIEDLFGLLGKYSSRFQQLREGVKPFAEAIAAKNTLSAYTAEPPLDVFFHLKRYITNHWEQLREATTVLYAEKPDLEFAIQYYDHFEEPEQAEEHQKKYESSVIAPIFTLETGAWTLMGPFKENRARVNFYNKNTEIMKRIFEQMEMDQRLGKDMMEKRVRAQKKKNIETDGPDDPGLAKYSAALTTIDSLGAKKVLSEEDKRALTDATREKEMREVPDNAVQVDVFHQDDSGKLVRDKFFTQSEAPEFMEKQIDELKQQLATGSKAHNPTDKTIVGRGGKKTTINALKAAGDTVEEDNIAQ